MSVLLDIKNLTVSLPHGGERGYAVRNLTLQVPRGKTVCVVGESGSGKSVMANAVMRLLPAHSLRLDSGEIVLDGLSLLSLDPLEMRAIRGARIGMIFQEPMTSLNPVMPVGEQIDEVLLVHGVKDPAQRARRVLELLRDMKLPQPEQIKDRYPFQLSGGQRQRILIAMAMAMEPQLLIADEPTTALDATTQAQILLLIKELQERHGIGVLFITHDFGVVADIADHVVVMRHGEVVEQGSAQDVLGQPQHEYTQGLLAAVPRLNVDPGAAPVRAAAPLLQIRDLCKTYPARGGLFNSGKRTVALDHINLDILPGETVGLVGESGSGKTTLGQCVVRLLAADSGELLFDGQPLHALKGRELQRMRPQIQMVFQDPFASLNPRHRVERIITENLILTGVSRKEARARMREVLQLVGMNPDTAPLRYPHEFSGGQRQRIGIARAIVMRPKLLVADEAVSALDVSVQQQVLTLLRDVRRELGLAMLFVTHDLRVASQICDRIAVMNKGQLVELGSVYDIATRPQHRYTQELFDAMPGREWAEPAPAVTASGVGGVGGPAFKMAAFA
ncbi:ABC transporter ATP-binding protein [Bordetella trematum]|uniref:ABC transporter ATP-binding protein n=1 Tax=Bordetella trematum TaxID=123899 RepID=UPI000D8CAED7|nr:ABC transporter ATP-binding protein [Bordetella trematum]SPU50888.1 ABC transporter ATP-binding protein [Bordetella trematum]VDH07136.1 Glutathione import ATP-binding protein GsiA [Bordetella trematum]